MSRLIAIASRLSAALQPASTQCTRCGSDRGSANDAAAGSARPAELGLASLPTLLMTNHHDLSWRRIFASVPQASDHHQVRRVGCFDNTAACTQSASLALRKAAHAAATEHPDIKVMAATQARTQATTECAPMWFQARGFAIGPDSASTAGAPDRGTDSGDPVGAQGTSTPPAGGSPPTTVSVSYCRHRCCAADSLTRRRGWLQVVGMLNRWSLLGLWCSVDVHEGFGTTPDCFTEVRCLTASPLRPGVRAQHQSCDTQPWAMS